jgi:hypothetical protein
MAVTFTHVFLWGSSATNHIKNAQMGSPLPKKYTLIVLSMLFQQALYIFQLTVEHPCFTAA